MTRLAWVDRAKGIAILLVVLHHVIQFSADLRWASDDVIYFNTMLQTLRMPLFCDVGVVFSRGGVRVVAMAYGESCSALPVPVRDMYIFALALYFVVAKVLSPLPSWSQLAIIAAVSVPVATHLIEIAWAWQFIGMYGLAFFVGMRRPLLG